MRVTQSMLSHNMLKNLSSSYSKMDTYMDQLSTGKKINRPSDDPVVATKGIHYRSELAGIEQFQRNINTVHKWMDHSDAALDKATQTLQKMQELAVQASNDTYDDKQRKNIQEEVEQLRQHLVDVANTSVHGQYIFNGTDTDEKPVAIEDNEFPDNASPVMIKIANSSKIQANVDATNLFDEALFSDIQAFMDKLESGDDQEAIEDSIGALDEQIHDVINARADLGARMNRLELVENRLNDQEIMATKTMSDNEDIDYEQVITDLVSQESVHQAALSVGGRIIQPTLIDFLR